MIDSAPCILRHSACFTIQRERAKGYCVSSAEGPRADQWREHALTVLDALGQPDPDGPKEYFRLIVMPTGDLVAAIVKLKDNGEALYYQYWYQVADLVSYSRGWLSLLLVVFALIFSFFAGVGADRAFLSGDGPDFAGRLQRMKAGQGNDQLKIVRCEQQLKALWETAKGSRDVCQKLVSYLSQEGFAATDLSNSPVKSSVRLIDDLDKSPPRVASIRLNNIEVAKLLALLEAVEDWINGPQTSPTSKER